MEVCLGRAPGPSEHKLLAEYLPSRHRLYFQLPPLELL